MILIRRDQGGNNPLHFAFSYGYAEICELLKNKAAHPLQGSAKEDALEISDNDDPSASTRKRKVNEASGEERSLKKPQNVER